MFMELCLSVGLLACVSCRPGCFMELCLLVSLSACVSCRPGCSWSSAYLLVCRHVCPVDQDVQAAAHLPGMGLEHGLPEHLSQIGT